MTKTRYVIVEIQPLLCPFRDGIIGSRHRVRWDLGTFQTLAWAQKRCGRVAREHYDNCGDSSFDVGAAADPLRPLWTREWAAPEDDMPF